MPISSLGMVLNNKSLQKQMVCSFKLASISEGRYILLSRKIYMVNYQKALGMFKVVECILRPLMPKDHRLNSVITQPVLPLARLGLARYIAEAKLFMINPNPGIILII